MGVSGDSGAFHTLLTSYGSNWRFYSDTNRTFLSSPTLTWSWFTSAYAVVSPLASSSEIFEAGNSSPQRLASSCGSWNIDWPCREDVSGLFILSRAWVRASRLISPEAEGTLDPASMSAILGTLRLSGSSRRSSWLSSSKSKSPRDFLPFT